ncbi:S-layer homology domain-containing protein [Sporosarcina sp. E16_3]|uniref:S-layer homology domain-containing protein n=1 Tax=Sporosarcina sp. E16_3 TaxID=2789293 RepID=UPI001A91E3AF|nr:S-layer homology domain-containing protein [Sporosarcina sp. E16_3]MBO0601182.1 S-layer homology domain-containing protein [Sporosarcina sp. E16_3]
MRKNSSILFRAICMVLLVFTTIAPSIAQADANNGFSITINAGSENRDIISISAYIQSKNQGYGHMDLINDNGDLRLVNPDFKINPQDEYKVLVFVNFMENGSKYLNVEELMLSGIDMTGDTEFTIPATGGLMTSRISDMEPATDMQGWINIDDKEWPRVRLPLRETEIIVSTKDLEGTLSFKGMVGEKKHFLTSPIVMGKDVTFDSLTNDISEVVLQDKSQTITFIDFVNNIDFAAVGTADETIVISNGKYLMNFESLGLEWSGDIDITNNQTIKLNMEPTDISISHASQYINPVTNELQLSYNLALKSGPFQGQMNGKKEIQFKFSNGTKVISEWVELNNGGEKTFEADELQSGTYTLEAAIEVNGQLLTVTKKLQINSAFNTLKGTVITAEDGSGQALQSGTVSLYEVKKYHGNDYYETMKNVSIKPEKDAFEAFIPDAYILDGKEYILTVIDESEKVAYSKRFIGQEEKNLHLSSESLKELKINFGDLTALDVRYELYNPTSNSDYIPLALTGTGWKVATDLDVRIDWLGKDSNHVGYNWSGNIDIEKGEVVDIANTQWKSYKPSSSYPKAEIGIYQSENLFKELKINKQTFYYSKMMQLVVKDGNTTYSGVMNIRDNQTENEVKFTTYFGNAHMNEDNKKVTLFYHGEGGPDLQVESTDTANPPSYTYEIYDEMNKLVGKQITTNKLNLLELESPLPQGIYTVKLVSTTLNPSIVTLSMDTRLEVRIKSSPNEAQIEQLPVQLQTKYGNFERSDSSIKISERSDGNEYKPNAYFYWNNELKVFETNQPFTISPSRQYVLEISMFDYYSTTRVIDEKVMTGQQLLDITTEIPLQVSDDLHLLTVNTAYVENRSKYVELILRKKGGDTSNDIRNLSPRNSSINVYLPNQTYLGSLIARERDKSVEIVSIPDFTMDQDREISTNFSDLRKISFVKGKEALSIFGYQTFDERNYPYQPDTQIQSVSYAQGKYKDLKFGIASREQQGTPWGYEITIPQLNLDKDTQLNFTDEIKGSIEKVEIQPTQYGQSLLLIDYILTSGDLLVDGIYRAIERDRLNTQSLNSKAADPVRDYTGLFNEWNRVSNSISLVDSKGKAVWSQSDNYYPSQQGQFYLPQSIEPGEYTLQIHVPIASGKSITLKEKVSIKEQGKPFVQITSPKADSLTNDETVAVTGTANANIMINLELQRDFKTIEKVKVSTDGQGKFQHEFKTTADGIYKVIAINEDKRSEVIFTVGKSVLEKAKNLKVEKQDTSIYISWTGPNNAVSYTVEVAENDQPFTILSKKQKATTATISNVKQDTTYKVRITSYDQAGNMSLTDVATYVSGGGAPEGEESPGGDGASGGGGSAGGEGSAGNNGASNGNGSTGNNGSSGSSGNGGSVTPNPVIPPVVPDTAIGIEVIDSVTGDKTVIIGGQSLIVQITNQQQKEIVIPLSAKQDELVKSLSATIDQAVLKQIIDSNKPLAITANGAKMQISNETLKAIDVTDGESIKISVSVLEETDKLPKISNRQTLLSSLYDFNIVVLKEKQERKVTHFMKPIVITMNVGQVNNAEKVAAFYLNEKDNKWEYIGGKLAQGMFTFSTTHFSKFAVLENDSTFKDIHNKKVEWAADYIEVLASKNIIQGKTEDIFAPSDDITRAQFAALLSRALNLPKQPYAATFTDVSSTNWSAQDIEAANRVGIVQGEKGEFKPNDKITRQQMATMIIRAIQYRDPTSLNDVSSTLSFKDASLISDYAKEYVGLSASLGIISGRDDKGSFVFAPKENATRAHAAKMLYKFIEME